MNIRSVLRLALICAVWLMMPRELCLQAAEPANLVANGDFSQVSDGHPRNWQTAGDTAIVTQELRVVSERDGKRCARLSCTRFERQTPAAHAMLAQVGQVHLIRGRSYEFSCQFRAEGIAGRSVSIALSDTSTWQNCGMQTESPLSGTWKTCQRVFRATRDVGSTGRLQIWFTETGTLYVADVRIVECPVENAEFTDVVEASGSKNLLPNASFELGGSGWSSMASGVGWGNLSRLHGRIQASGGPQGGAFLRIPVGGDQTPVLHFDYYEPVTRREIHPLVANQGWIPVVKGAGYTLSCFMRASRTDVTAVLGVTAREPGGQGRDHRQQARLTTEWKRYSLSFNPDQRYVFVFAGPDLQKEEQVDVDVAAWQFERGDQVTEFAPHQSLEMALEPSENAGIFCDDQAAVLWLRICNYGEVPSRLRVRFQATDFEDRPVALPDCPLEIPARTNLQHKVELPRDWKGYYRVVASAESGGSRLTAQVRLAIVPRPVDSDSVCGINHAFGMPDLIRLASTVGVSCYRDWSLKWQHMEPVKGSYRWELADAQIDRVLQEGCSVLPLLPPFPSADWSSEAPPTLSTKGYPGVRARQAWAPKDPQELADFIERAATRYKDRIHTWEFLNEPVYTDYALPARPGGQSGGKSYTAADYVALLEKVSAAMRKADPVCKVIGGMAGGPKTLTREALEAGVLKYIDLFNLHIYPGLRAPEAYADEMAELLKSMEAHGGVKPIWITEFSYYGADNRPRRPFVPRPENWAEERLLDSERQCADYTLRFFLVMLSHGVQKIFIHSGASGTVNSPNFECALFDYGGTPRKLAPALAVLTHILGPAPKCVGTTTVGKGGYVAGFETGRQAVLVLWQSDDNEATSPPPFPGSEAAWMDVMGRKLPRPPTRLSSSVGYVLARSGRAAGLLERTLSGSR